MKTVLILLTVAYVLLLAAFVMAAPYAKKGYDLSVLEKYQSSMVLKESDLK